MRVKLVSVFLLLTLVPSLAFAKVKFSIDEDKVRLLSLQQSLQIQSIKLDQEIANQNLPQAKAIYDPQLSANVSHLQNKSQRATTIFGTETNTTAFGVGLKQKTPTGTSLSLGVDNQRESSDSLFATTNPAFDSSVEMGVSQSVGRNFLGLIDRKQIDMIRTQLMALDLATRRQIETIVAQNLINYWNFYLSYHLVQHENDGLSKAINLFRANQGKLSLGLIEDPDLQAFAANREVHRVQLYTAKDILASADFEVRKNLSLDLDITLVPSGPSLKNRPKLATATAVPMALENRKDYQALKSELEAQKINLAMAKNKRWPELDVLGSLSLNGLNTDYAAAVGNIGDGHPQWRVGLELTQNLLGRFSHSVFKQESARQAKKIFELKELELTIIKEVQETNEHYLNAWQRMQAALSARDYQNQKMSGEEKRYEQGRADSDTVIRSQNDYIEAKKLALQTQVDYEQARIKFDFARGKLLE